LLVKTCNTAATPVPVFRAWVRTGTPWEVAFPSSATTPRQRRFFKTPEEAQEAIDTWLKGRSPETSVGKRRLDALLQAQALLPPGISLLDAVRFFNSHHGPRSTSTLQDIATAYLKDIQRRSPKYRESATAFVDRAVAHFGGDVLMASLGRAQWLSWIKSSESYWNRYGMKRAASCLISTALEREVIDKSPLAGWKFEEAPKKRPHFLDLEQVTKVMTSVSTEAPELLPAFALQLWAGIRTEELCRASKDGRRALQWSDIRFGERIDVGPEVAKMRERGVIDFWPEALTSWLKNYKDAKGAICPVEDLSEAKYRLFTKLKLKVPQNSFRHSYATYVCAYFQDPGKATLYLRQRDTDVLWTNYRDYADEATAKLYFSNSPQA
jgi:hypothetical protein